MPPILNCPPNVNQKSWCLSTFQFLKTLIPQISKEVGGGFLRTRVVIDTVFVYHSFDPHLGGQDIIWKRRVNRIRVVLILKKADWGTCYRLDVFWFQKKNRFQKLSWPVLSSLDYRILLICLATVRNRGKDTH